MLIISDSSFRKRLTALYRYIVKYTVTNRIYNQEVVRDRILEKAKFLARVFLLKANKKFIADTVKVKDIFLENYSVIIIIKYSDSVFKPEDKYCSFEFNESGKLFILE